MQLPCECFFSRAILLNMLRIVLWKGAGQNIIAIIQGVSKKRGPFFKLV